jgi:FMN phosphatase YigB (HAD superfamily)
MSAIEVVFLDLGNVLAFHQDPILFQRMSAWGGAHPDRIRERMLELWHDINRGALAGDDLRRTICQVAGSDVPMDDEPFFELWNCHFVVNHALLPVVDQLLERVKVVLLSNTNEMHWRHVRPLIPQFERFHALVISCELLLAKPDPAIFHVALERAGVAADKTAFFDDVPRFVETACALGIHGRVFTDVPTFKRQLAELGIPIR